MSEYRIKTVFWGKLLLVVPGLCIIIGCHLMAVPKSVIIEPQNNLKDAETAFQQKQYTLAGQKFQKIYSQSQNPELKNAAFLGLICTEFMVAENQKEFQGFLISLKQWEQLDRDGPGVENPVLLVRVLEKTIMDARIETGLKLLEITKSNEKHKEEMEEMEEMRSVHKGLKEKISRLKKDIKTLRHQISELETIDKEIQEKRKPL